MRRSKGDVPLCRPTATEMYTHEVFIHDRFAKFNTAKIKRYRPTVFARIGCISAKSSSRLKLMNSTSDDHTARRESTNSCFVMRRIVWSLLQPNSTCFDWSFGILNISGFHPVKLSRIISHATQMNSAASEMYRSH
jgi:hypothetical protein